MTYFVFGAFIIILLWFSGASIAEKVGSTLVFLALGALLVWFVRALWSF